MFSTIVAIIIKIEVRYDRVPSGVSTKWNITVVMARNMKAKGIVYLGE
jgi:hypothetical protein